MCNNPITLEVMQTALDTAHKLGAYSRVDLCALLTPYNPLADHPLVYFAGFLHNLNLREAEINKIENPADDETTIGSYAPYFPQAFALAFAWNRVYGRESLLADYLYARGMYYAGNGDDWRNPLNPQPQFDAGIPHVLRAMLDIVAKDGADGP